MMLYAMLSLMTAACTLGPRADRLALATEPRGARVELRTHAARLAGELLEMQHSALVMLTEEKRVTFVPFEVIRDVRVETITGRMESMRLRSARQREEVRLLSRFPHGISDELRTRLLRKHNQSALEIAHHHADPAPRATAADDVIEFVNTAREATARYRDRSAAIADGFRRLGPDFPGMGEHWIHPGRMVDGVIDAARPQALSYAMIDGRPHLLGAIYATPLGPGDAPPDAGPGAGHWHDHTGSIDEESVLLNHTPSAASATSDVRLAMLHAWVWLDNPDGTFAADNWSVPFVRLGLEPPPEPAPAAARALSLAADGVAYYLLLFRALARPTPDEEAVVGARLGRARVLVRHRLHDR
jgi:hypothetical protein